LLKNATPLIKKADPNGQAAEPLDIIFTAALGGARDGDTDLRPAASCQNLNAILGTSGPSVGSRNPHPRQHIRYAAVSAVVPTPCGITVTSHDDLPTAVDFLPQAHVPVGPLPRTTPISQGGEVRDVLAPDDAPPDFTLALEEARRGFDQLTAELAAVRQRAASAISIGSVSAAFVGGLALRDKGASPSVWTGLAVLAFALVVASGLKVLWPRRFWTAVDAPTLIGWAMGTNTIDGEPLTPEWMTMYLAQSIDQKYEENKPIVDRLAVWYSMGLVALVLEVIFLIVDLATR
jgi:hypothetical protein